MAVLLFALVKVLIEFRRNTHGSELLERFNRLFCSQQSVPLHGLSCEILLNLIEQSSNLIGMGEEVDTEPVVFVVDLLLLSLGSFHLAQLCACKSEFSMMIMIKQKSRFTRFARTLANVSCSRGSYSRGLPEPVNYRNCNHP